MRIAIIGFGNIGRALATGLIRSGAVKKENLIVTRKSKNTEKKPAFNFLINTKAVEFADILILAVKPHQAAEVLTEISPCIDKKRHQIISLVTGFKISSILEICPGIPVYRAVPNTAISIDDSITCIAANHANEKNLSVVIELFSKLGCVEIVDERLIDAATVLGACGIAYALRFIRAASQGGTEIGFSAEQALKITAQVVKGAANLILESGLHPEQEIDKVATPRGITITGLNEMEHQGFSSALIKGIVASFDKINQVFPDKR